MKALKGIVKHHSIVMGVDPSTKILAISVVDRGQVISITKLKLPRGDIVDRLAVIRKWFNAMLVNHKPTLVVIESPVFVQNPLSSKNLAYVVGILFGACLDKGIEVHDVPPTKWKSWLGYSPVSKEKRKEIMAEMGSTEGRKELHRLRKVQTQDYMRENFPKFSWEDDNLADSAGIALFAFHNYDTL